jgi:CheY-like chemotaxis protein
VPKSLYGDPVRLNQILTNLVGNAVKFTETGAVEVIVSANTDSEDNLRVQFDVKDSGIGIPEDKQGLVFESFTQSSAETTRKYGGTGLGLSIVKQLVELHNGDISITSKENVGSTFHVCIPYKAAPEVAKTSSVNADLLEFSALANKKVLVVDDNAINLMVAKQTLKKANIQVEVAISGAKAIEMLLNDDFFVVLMDVHMPDMNGYETTAKIRDELKMNIPIIAMTASAMVEDQEKCRKARMDEYIAKPFVPNELFTKLLSFV